ncbi:MAG: hypothetical protein IAG13_12020 [Deltaproteobacteria bacterium]|nr:hypothetical protein [Nannocystaceae bacterium]
MHDARLVAGVFMASLAYAVVRYNVFGAVDWQQLPVFVTNKAVSVAGLAMLGISRVVVDKARRKQLGLVGAALSGLHVLLSLMVLEPSYLAKLYLPNGAMTGSAELSMLTGAVATVLLGWLLYATVQRPLDVQSSGVSLVRGLGRFVLVLVAAHVAFIGWAGWLDVATWPGRLPPITLLSFAIALGFCLLPKARRPAA